MNGVVHHALAFNTLLSSQETDAYTVDPRPIEIRHTGAFHSVLSLCPYSFRPAFSCQTGPFDRLDSIPAI